MKSPLITMSAITGNPTREEIDHYMSNLNSNGIEQVMLYPRSGCEIDYLSDEWFETIGYFLEAAKRLDMHVWLYDEYNWPSGDAGGRVTKVEEFRLKAINIKGEAIGKIYCHTTHNASLFGEKFFPDLLSEKAVDYFIACTHEKYYEKFSAFFGTVIKGFFTDEPSIGYCCTKTSIPYYTGIEEEYKSLCGRDFTEDMQSSHEDFCKNAVTVISDRFHNCFIKKLTDWCASHKILMTGHLLADNGLFAAVRYNGDFLKNLSAFSLPGVDEISTKFDDDSLMTLLCGAEYAHTEHGAMAELFALGPCDMSYATKCCMIFLTACFKINHYFLAVSHMDMRGNTKIQDYFNNFTIDQPDFNGVVLLSEAAKIAAEYAKKDYTPDVYIKHPTDICANHIADTLDVKPFTDIIEKLTFYQLQWKFLKSGDDCKDIPVIEFNDNMEYCMGGIVTKDAEEICSLLPKRITVTDANGNIPQGFFVRKFNDNTCIVLNLYGKPQVCRVNGQDVEFDERGIFVSTMPQKSVLHSEKEQIDAIFHVNYCNDNMIRAMFINSQTTSEIVADSEFDVRFAVRKDASACLNGEKIEVANTANTLSDGFKKLYDVSAPVKLHKGTHILKSGNDFKYLPSVFVIGDFSAQANSGDVCAITLDKRAHSYHCGEEMKDFGKIEFSAHVTVPKNAKAIEIKGTNLYTCVYADDTLIGKKICFPYVFPINKALQGMRITLKITQYSSIAPVFADVDYFDQHSEAVQWRGTPAPTNVPFGFHEINWIF